MTQQPFQRPTEAELEILLVLWKHNPCTVRFVNDLLTKKRKVGYTTTLKIMQNLFEKHMLERDETSRSHLYSAKIKQKDTQRFLLDKFMQSTFEGSAMNLVMQALGHHKTSKEEISKIRELLDQIEGVKQ